MTATSNSLMYLNGVHKMREKGQDLIFRLKCQIYYAKLYFLRFLHVSKNVSIVDTNIYDRIFVFISIPYKS